MSLKITEVNLKEDVVKLIAEMDINLYGFAIIDETFASAGKETDTFRHIYIFPKQDVKKGDKILLYTKVGKNASVKSASGTTYFFYWGAKSKVWNNTGDKAFLIQYKTISSKAVE